MDSDDGGETHRGSIYHTAVPFPSHSAPPIPATWSNARPPLSSASATYPRHTSSEAYVTTTEARRSKTRRATFLGADTPSVPGEEGMEGWDSLPRISPDREGFMATDEGTRRAGRVKSHPTLRTFFEDPSKAVPDHSSSVQTGLDTSAGGARCPPEGSEDESHLLDHTLTDIPNDRARSPQENGEAKDVFSTRPSMLRSVWPLSPVSIAVLKCSIAYLLASLFTFVPFLARLLTTTYEEDAHGRISRKPAFSAHMVATVVIYFNPAKSAGNMLLADRYCFILALISTLVCLASMFTVHAFDAWSPAPGTIGDWISEMGDWVVCFLWIGGSMGVQAWGKVYVGNPVFNAGCSMAAITIFSVVIKEGNVPKLAEILLIVLSGVVCSNLVCFTVFPMSATTKLHTSIKRSLTSSAKLLELSTSAFLQQNPTESPNADLRNAIAAHSNTLKILQSDLAEAKHERMLDTRARGKRVKLYEEVVGSLGRLAQHLSGLRGSMRMPGGLLEVKDRGKLHGRLQKDDESCGVGGLDAVTDGFVSAEQTVLEEIIEMFSLLQNGAAAEMRVLVTALYLVQTPLLDNSKSEADLTTVVKDLTVALEQFSKATSRVIGRLCAESRQTEVYKGAEDALSDVSFSANGRGGPHGSGEVVFRAYFFLSTLEEFARELVALLEKMADISSSGPGSIWDRIKSRFCHNSNTGESYLYRTFQRVLPIASSNRRQPPFPSRPSSSHAHPATPLQYATWWSSLRSPIWRFGDWLTQPTQKYAIKVWLAGAMLAAPAYTEWGRAVFLEYRMEWALIAYFSTMSPTLGQTNHMSFSRAGGTFIGAFFGMVVYALFPNSPIVLAIIGFLFAMPCFYVITQMPEAMQTGRFTLLGYNLVCLYAYNKRDRDYPVFKIMVFRSITVIIGVLWTAIVSRFWWPYTARKELRLGISDFCLDLACLYSKLAALCGRGTAFAASGAAQIPNERSALLPEATASDEPSAQAIVAMELDLRHRLTTHRVLLAQTKNEPRLKGPFPTAFYNDVLLSLERILDKLHSIRIVALQRQWDAACAPHAAKRRCDLAGTVILYVISSLLVIPFAQWQMYVLSSAFKLRSPLPPRLPAAESARLEFVRALRTFDTVNGKSRRGGGELLLDFAYAVAMQDIVSELELLGSMAQDAFGVLTAESVVEFDSLFNGSPENLEVLLGEGGFLYREDS